MMESTASLKVARRSPENTCCLEMDNSAAIAARQVTKKLDYYSILYHRARLDGGHGLVPKASGGGTCRDPPHKCMTSRKMVPENG